MSDGSIKKLVFFLILPSFLIFSVACAPSKTDSPQKTNKLSSTLYGLVEADLNSEAELFASQNDVELIDGVKVRVNVVAVPGQLEQTGAKTANFGNVEEILPGTNTVRALIPIADLTALARETCVQVIEMPPTTVPKQAKRD